MDLIISIDVNTWNEIQKETEGKNENEIETVKKPTAINSLTTWHDLRKSKIFNYARKLEKIIAIQKRKIKQYRCKIQRLKVGKSKRVEDIRKNADSETLSKHKMIRKYSDNDLKLSIPLEKLRNGIYTETICPNLSIGSKDFKEFIEKIKLAIKFRKYSIRVSQYKNSDNRSREIITPTTAVDELDVEVIREKAFEFVNEIKTVAEVAKAVEVAANNQYDSEFIYEPTSGMYYHTATGFYYNTELELYYDDKNALYYKYNEKKNRFDFHSQALTETKKHTDIVDVIDLTGTAGRDRKPRKRRKYEKKQKYFDSDSDSDKQSEIREDGEISSSLSDDSVSEENIKTKSISRPSKEYKDVARKYPPSLRIVVQETNLSKLKVGELFVVTYKGGTLGREGAHDVIIPDINVSKYHLKFTYNSEKYYYECIDLGSRNGTLLNGSRMSNAKQESNSLVVSHGSTLQLSQTKLLCHIHDGIITCEHCEPGLIANKSKSTTGPTVLTHKAELKKLKKRYGLEDEKNILVQKIKNDRAAQRRKVVGSTNEHEKTSTASLEQEISNENKGFKMLSKLGWSKGQKLGKNDSGLLEPVPITSNVGQKGLGCEMVTIPIDYKLEKKNEKWKKAQDRYDKVETITSSEFVFNLNDDN